MATRYFRRFEIQDHGDVPEGARCHAGFGTVNYGLVEVTPPDSTPTERNPMADTKVTVDSGKYTFRVTDRGRVLCDRYDIIDWVEFDKGSKALISLIHHAAELEERAGERPGPEAPPPAPVGFPVHSDDHKLGILTVPWAFLAPHEAQAIKNHDQDLATLARRGGLGVKEMLAVVEDMSYLRMAVTEDVVAAALLKNHLTEWQAQQAPPVQRKQLKIEGTPLGLARKAVDTAIHEIEAEIERWSEEGPPYDHNCPGGEYELRLEPDPGSLGFTLVLEFHDREGEEVRPIAARLAPLLERHGVTSVRVLGHVYDEIDVEAFDEKTNVEAFDE